MISETKTQGYFGLHLFKVYSPQFSTMNIKQDLYKNLT